MATLQDTDHLLINRAGQTYKITGEDLINSVIDPLEVTVILAPTEGYTDTEVTAVPVVSGGKQPDGGYIFTYQWVTADDDAGDNKANIAGANEATFTPDNAQVGKYLGCVVSTTDALGTSAEGEAYIGPIQVLAQAPVIADVVVSEIYDGANRFTDKEFPYVTTMAVDGEPNPTYEVKAKLSGTTFDFDVISDVITDVEGGGIKTCETELIESVDETEITYSSFMSLGANMLQAFDGNLATYSYPLTANETIDWDYTPTLPYNSIKIYCSYSGTQAGSPSFKVNDVECLDILQNYTGGDLFLDEAQLAAKGITSPLYSIEITASSNAGNTGVLNGIEIDGKLLVDGDKQVELTFPSSNGFDCFETGDVVQDPDVKVISKDEDANTITVDGGEWYVPSGTAGQEYRWSNYVSLSSGDYYSSDPPTQLFDGLTATPCNPADTNATITFVPPVPIDYTVKVEFHTSGLVNIQSMGQRQLHTLLLKGGKI